VSGEGFSDHAKSLSVSANLGEVSAGGELVDHASRDGTVEEKDFVEALSDGIKLTAELLGLVLLPVGVGEVVGLEADQVEAAQELLVGLLGSAGPVHVLELEQEAALVKLVVALLLDRVVEFGEEFGVADLLLLNTEVGDEAENNEDRKDETKQNGQEDSERDFHVDGGEVGTDTHQGGEHNEKDEVSLPWDIQRLDPVDLGDSVSHCLSRFLDVSRQVVEDMILLNIGVSSSLGLSEELLHLEGLDGGEDRGVDDAGPLDSVVPDVCLVTHTYFY